MPPARPLENQPVAAAETRESGGGGAGNGNRTRDIQLGKLALYQLSYARPDATGGSGRAAVVSLGAARNRSTPPEGESTRMPPRSRGSRGPRALARALAEIARRQVAARPEAELRAVLPAALGAWLLSRVEDVSLRDGECTLTMCDARAARHARELRAEILGALARQLGPAAPSSVAFRVSASPRRAPTARAAGAPRPTTAGPLTQDALAEVADPDLRRRLARWAGLDEPG